MQAIQTWTGCTQTISVAQIVSVPENPLAPELLHERTRQPHITIEARPEFPALSGAGERNIATLEETHLPKPSPTLAVSEAPIEMPAEPPAAAPSHSPSTQGARALWGRLSVPAHLESVALRMLPEEPGEVRYRVWVDPVKEAIKFSLPAAPASPCPLETLPEPDPNSAQLAASESASLPRSPEVDESAAAALTQSAGSPLDAIQTQQISRPEAMLYPATRRLPNPVLS